MGRVTYVKCEDARDWLAERPYQADLVLTDPPHLDTFKSAEEHRLFVNQWMPLALEARKRYGTLIHSCGESAAELLNYMQWSPDQIRIWIHETGFHYHLVYGATIDGSVIRDIKPKPLWDNILADVTEDRDIVFDPFCGRGEIPDAARRMGCYYRGCDINADSIAYCMNELKL